MNDEQKQSNPSPYNTLQSLYIIGKMHEENMERMKDQPRPTVEQLFRLGSVFEKALEDSGMTREEFYEHIRVEAEKRATMYQQALETLYGGRIPTQEEIDRAEREGEARERIAEQKRIDSIERKEEREDAMYGDLTAQVMDKLQSKEG